jgi:predicted nucleic-acid-binding protein
VRAVDTNVLVRLITRDDVAQLASAESFVEKSVWVSLLVLAEMTWVLRVAFGFTPEQIVTSVEILLDHDKVSVQDADVVVAALSHYRRKPALGFSDCLVLEIARKAGHLPLGTFDRNLSKLDGVERL